MSRFGLTNGIGVKLRGAANAARSLTASPFSPAFSPLSLSPAIWLDALDASTVTITDSKVSAWADKSGNGRNFGQSNAAKRPTYASSGVVFDYTANGSLGVNSTIALTGESIFVVVKRNGGDPESSPRVFSQNATVEEDYNNFVPLLFSPNQTSSVYSYIGGGLVSGMGALSNATKYILECDIGASLNNRVNGGSPSNSANTINYSAVRFAIGNLSGTETLNSAFNGTIYEVLMFPRSLTDAERISVERYLSAKHGVALA